MPYGPTTGSTGTAMGGFNRVPFSVGNIQDNGFFTDPDIGFHNAFAQLLGLYQPRYQGTNAYGFLQGPGERLAQQQYDILTSQFESQGRGDQVPDYLSFFKDYYDPTQAYNALSPRDRGENPAAFGGFTRYLPR